MEELITERCINYGKLLMGKRVFVTTAVQGIGKAIALLLAEHGASVAVGGRNPEKLNETVSQLRKISPGSFGCLCELSDKTSVESACDRVLESFGGLDVLVNTVGINHMFSIHSISDEEIEEMIATNYKSGLYCARKFLPGMMRQKKGNIVNISSVHSIQTSGKSGLYAGTKAAVEATTRAMAVDYAPYGIRVNAVLPGLIMSDVMMRSVSEKQEGKQRDDYIAKLKTIQPLPPGQVGDIANAVLFLASEMSAFITGQALIVDGGGCVTNKW